MQPVASIAAAENCETKTWDLELRERQAPILLLFTWVIFHKNLANFEQNTPLWLGARSQEAQKG